MKYRIEFEVKQGHTPNINFQVRDDGTFVFKTKGPLRNLVIDPIVDLKDMKVEQE